MAGFIGSPQMNFFDGQLSKKDGKYQIQVGEAAIVLADEAQERLSQRGAGDQAVVVGIRPEHISFATTPGSHTIASKVDVSEMMGGPGRGAAHPHRGAARRAPQRHPLRHRHPLHLPS